MDGEELGTQGTTEENAASTAVQGTENAQAQEVLLDGGGNGSPNGADGDSGNAAGGETNTVSEVTGADEFKAQLAERDREIASLKAQVVEAAKSAEAADALNARIAELEAKAESERVDFELKLASCRSTRAGKALLDEHDGDIAALKAAEPWLFEEKDAAPAGVTGLPNAGTASSDDAQIAHWREIAGLDD